MLKRLLLTILLLLVTSTLAPCGQRYIKFDAQTGVFTVTNTIIGNVSGATAVIKAIQDDGTTGVLELIQVVGAFKDNEIIYEATLGGELIVNGGFDTDTDWEKSASVTINDGEAIFTDSPVFDYLASVNEQPDPCTVGQFYQVEFDITNYIEGNIQFVNTILGVSENGNYILQFQAEVAYIVFYGFGATNNFHIDNVSVEQITNAALANGALYGGARSAW